MSAMASLRAQPADVIVVDTSPSPPSHDHDSFHPPQSATHSPQVLSPTALSPAALSPSPDDDDVIVLDTPNSPQRAAGPETILVDDTPRKRRRADNPVNTRAIPSQDTSPVIVVDDDDDADGNESDAVAHVQSHQIDENENESNDVFSSSSSEEDDMEDEDSSSSIAPHVPETISTHSIPDGDEVIEVSAVGPRAVPSSSRAPPVHPPVMPLEPRLSAPRSRAPVYQRTQRQGTNAMSMPQLFNRNADSPSRAPPSTIRAEPIIRRRYGLPNAGARAPSASGAQALRPTPSPPLMVPTLELSRGLLSSSSTLRNARRSHVHEMLDLHELNDTGSPPISPAPNSGHGLNEFMSLSRELGGRLGAPSPSNAPGAATAVSSDEPVRPLPRLSRTIELTSPTGHRANGSTAGRQGSAGHGHGTLPSVAQSSANPRQTHRSHRHVTFADTVTSIGHSAGVGISNGIFAIGPSGTHGMFGRFSNGARHNPNFNGHGSHGRAMASSSSSGAGNTIASVAARVSVSPRVGGTYRRRSGVAGSAAGSSGAGRRRTTPGSRAYSHYFHMVGVGDRIHLQLLQGAMNDRLDYEQLVQLDEQLIREKNRADKDQIEALPLETATESDKEVRCCVCMCDVEPGEELRVLPCSHKYHKSCIDEWLTYNGCCPVDKKRIAPSRSRRKATSRRNVRQRTN